LPAYWALRREASCTFEKGCPRINDVGGESVLDEGCDQCAGCGRVMRWGTLDTSHNELEKGERIKKHGAMRTITEKSPGPDVLRPPTTMGKRPHHCVCIQHHPPQGGYRSEGTCICL